MYKQQINVKILAMQPTSYPHVNDALNHLLAQLQTILADKFVGLYLYGSLVTGDFDDASSDIDLLTVLTSDLEAREFDALNKMQAAFVLNNPHWENRLEIAYVSLHALETFKTQTSTIGVISPGEPFHLKDAGRDWLMNWYMVREKGATLFGSTPDRIIEAISKAEFIEAVKAYVREWQDWFDEGVKTRPSQAYAILTMCRAMYTVQNGEQVSKKRAAVWAQKELPEWATLIGEALLWRKNWKDDADHAATLPEARRFVHMVIDRILGKDTTEIHGG